MLFSLFAYEGDYASLAITLIAGFIAQGHTTSDAIDLAEETLDDLGIKPKL